MMLLRILLCTTLLLPAISAMAQRPVFEPGTFVDPDMLDGSLFLMGIALGGVSNPSDHYRSIDGNVGFVLLTNSLYVGRFQFDYKHGEFIGKDDPPVQRCDCPDPIYFPTLPPGGAAPTTVARRKDTLQVGFYRTFGRSSPTPRTLRYRLSVDLQETDTDVTSVSTGETVEHLSGHDRSFTFDADTHFSMAGINVWGTLNVARSIVSGTTNDHTQNVFSYVSRFPGFNIESVLFRPELAIGRVTNRGASGLNLFNPSLEAYYRHDKTRTNWRLVLSTEWTKDGVEGWQVNNQVAIVVDRNFYLKAFGRPREE